MRLLFVDTAGWIACADGSDPAHGKAVADRDSWLDRGGLFVTSDYVADETLRHSTVRPDSLIHSHDHPFKLIHPLIVAFKIQKRLQL